MAAYDVVMAAPNSAVDSYYIVDRLALGEVHKARTAFHTAGGKGLNAARALRNLGGRPLCVGIVAGHAGRFIAGELDREDMAYDLVWAEGETRRCSTVYVPGSPDTTVMLENGQHFASETCTALADRILAHALDAPYVALVGSLPSGFAEDFYSGLIHRLRAAGARVCIDCAGQSLRLAAAAGPSVIKVNRSEFAGAFLPDDGVFLPVTAGRVYAGLHARGLELLVVTDGPAGSYVFSGEPGQGAILHACTPAQNIASVVSTAGSGDAYLAGLLLLLGRGEPLAEAVRFASAASAANLLEIGCGVLDLRQVETLLPATVLETQTWS
jgi:tagatose 6-phosphate kinase